MSFAVFCRDGDGCIVGYQTVLPNEGIEPPVGCIVVMSNTSPQVPGYYDGRDFRRIPEAPDLSYRWDWQSKAWVLDSSLQVAALAKASADSLLAIDEAAGQARLKYITSVPGQSETYQRKEQQAREWASSGFVGTAPSFIAAEAEALNVAPQAIANEVIQLADYWANVKGPEIEAARRKWKVTIEAAGSNLAAIQAALRDGLAELGAL